MNKPYLPILRLLACCSLMAASITNLPAQQIFVDNDNGAPGYTETGSWSTTGNIGAGWNGGSYRFNSNQGVFSTATWTPILPETSFYRVVSIFRASGDRPSVAPYTIDHADGSANVTVDQTGSFSGDLAERFLGTYRFESGSIGSVTLNNTGNSGAYIADTILFEKEPPPSLSNFKFFPIYPQANDPVGIRISVTDDSGVGNVTISWTSSPSNLSGSLAAADDGLSGDGDAGDGIFGADIPGFPDGESVIVSVTASDTFGISQTSDFPEIVIGLTGEFNLLINEIVSSNAESAFDLDLNESGDWIEIYNTGPDVADLTGIAVSDNASQPAKWLFPEGSTLGANEYLILWCDDENFEGLEYHTSFKLSSGGEDAVLFDTNTGTAIDSVTFPALETDQSWARIPNITGSFEATILTTPRSENLSGMRGNAPSFSVGSGIYDAPLSVEITALGSSEIRYTLDGREPDQTSTLYTAPLSVTSTTGLRAKAYYDTLENSLDAFASYLFDMPTDREIPVISIIMNPDEFIDIRNNFEERGRAWERTTHVSVLSPDGSRVDESGAGIRIHGGFSRTAAKKSFRLYFRNSYGNPDWSLPWLERTQNSSFEQLVLRAGGNDGFLVTSTAQVNQVTLIRDQIMRDWFHHQGHFAADGFFAALYINGEYRGMYNATERITADTMTQVEGPDEWDIMKGTWNFTVKFFTEATEGDLDKWNEFLDWHRTSDLSTDEDLAELKTRIDYQNFLDWMALNIVCQNEDWPHNNWIVTSAKNLPDARFTFHEWDSEWGLGLQPRGWQSDSLTWTQGSNFHNFTSHNGFIAPLSNLFNGSDLDRTTPNPMVNGLLDHPEGVRDFINSVEQFLNVTFAEDKTIPELDHYVSLIESEIPREASRWAASSILSESGINSQWPVAVQNVRDFLANRPDFIRQLIIDEFNLSGTLTVSVEKAGTGSGFMAVNGEVVELPWTGTFFDGSQPVLTAIPSGGSSFTGWSGAIISDEQEISQTISSGPDSTLVLTFGQAPLDGPQPNDVIINEYWVNDDLSEYRIGQIEGDWIELLVVRDGVDLRGYRLTDNDSVANQDAFEDGDGSIVLPNLDVLENVASGTIILILSSANETNNATFPEDDLDASDFRLVFYVTNGNLDITSNPGFNPGTADGSVALVAPGNLPSYLDDIGIDFIAEGATITPDSFFSAPSGVIFDNPFGGIGTNDGAVFTTDDQSLFINDNGDDVSRGDADPGTGGWIVDPGSSLTGDGGAPIANILTPGYPNPGQDLPGNVIESHLWYIR